MHFCPWIWLVPSGLGKRCELSEQNLKQNWIRFILALKYEIWWHQFQLGIFSWVHFWHKSEIGDLGFLCPRFLATGTGTTNMRKTEAEWQSAEKWKQNGSQSGHIIKLTVAAFGTFCSPVNG